MAFAEKKRQGEILGCKVTTSPVSVAELAELEESQKRGSVAVMEAMCDIIDRHILDDEGKCVNARSLSSRAVKELFSFAIGTEGIEVADFSAPPA